MLRVVVTLCVAGIACARCGDFQYSLDIQTFAWDYKIKNIYFYSHVYTISRKDAIIHIAHHSFDLQLGPVCIASKRYIYKLELLPFTTSVGDVRYLSLGDCSWKRYLARILTEVPFSEKIQLTRYSFLKKEETPFVKDYRCFYMWFRW